MGHADNQGRNAMNGEIDGSSEGNDMWSNRSRLRATILCLGVLGG